MIMELPKEFLYYKGDYRYAIVKDGILYMKGVVNFEELVYSLTYVKKGNSKCYFCNKNVPKNRITLDHMYPRCYGGVSITNNLLPSCSKCNSAKNFLNIQEYKVYRRISGKKEQHEFQRIIFDKNEEIRFARGFILPKSWVQYISVDDIVIKTFINNYKSGHKYRQYIEFINTYHHLPKPIVISSNNVLLDGYVTLMCAIECGFTRVPVVKLDNVVVVNS